MMRGHVSNGYKLLWESGYRAFRIVACCDTVEANAANLASEIAEWQARPPSVFDDFDALMDAAASFDAACAVVPHSEHHKVAVPLLSERMPLLIEKPLAITMRAGKKMLDAAESTGTLLAVAENYRRSPQQRAIHWVVCSGRIGAPRHIHWLDVKERLWHWGWRDDRMAAGGGWTLDSGVHYADLMLYHLGPLAWLSALSHQYNDRRSRDRKRIELDTPATIEDTTMAILEFENGVTGVWSECISAAGMPIAQQVIHGEEESVDFKAGLKLRDRDQATPIEALVEEFVRQLDDTQREAYFPLGIRDAPAQETHEFIEACRHGTPVETNGLDGYKAQAICMAVYESATLGGTPLTMKQVETLEVEEYQKDLNAALGL